MQSETKSRHDRRGLLIAAPLIAFWLTACGQVATPTYFVPPTREIPPLAPPVGAPPAAAAPIVEPSPTATELPPSPTPTCSDDLDYLQDLTIPDGTIMGAGETIDKRWQVRNSGSCNWDRRYSLRLISGDGMGAGDSIPLYPARAGTEATLQVLFTAPQDPGVYECQWQAVNPDGLPFGDAFFMQIIVGG